MAKPREDGDQLSDEKIGAFPVREHIAAFEHVRIVGVHGYRCAELLAEIGGIAGMVEIAVSQKDQPEVTRPAARTLQFFFDLNALMRTSRVDQDVSLVSLDEVAVDTPYTIGQRKSNGSGDYSQVVRR